MTEPDTASRNAASPILTIGVTSLPMMRACPRAVALGKHPFPPDRLPAAHPYALLGTLYHNFVEQVARGEAGNPATEASLEALWKKCLFTVQKDNRSTPDSCWLPFDSTMPDLERTRLRAFRAARQLTIASSPMPSSGSSSGLSPRLRGPEVPVSLRVGGIVLKGKIDMVSEQGSSLQVVDYKTGSVTDETGAIKTEYVEQLQIYAGMLQMANGGAADRLLLIDRSGTEHAIGSDQPTIQTRLEVAERSLQDFERLWPGDAASDRTIMLSYPANPSDATCSRCGYRHRCDEHLQRSSREGVVPLGRSERIYESTDLYGRVESASRCSLGWAIRLHTPAGRVHLRGAMPAEPAPGDRLLAFGVTPGPANPTPRPEEANDFIVPRWGKVQIESDATPVPSWPDRPKHADTVEEPATPPRRIQPGDVCLEIHGSSHVDRIIVGDRESQAERAVEAAAMPPYFLAHIATLKEIRALVEAASNTSRVIWCRTTQASQWLDEIPDKSLRKLTGSESWSSIFEDQRRWWEELRANRSVVITQEKARLDYPNGPVTTVHVDGKPIVRVAVPCDERFPRANPTFATRKAVPPPETKELSDAGASNIQQSAASAPTGFMAELDNDPDFEISTHVPGNRGPGKVTITPCSDRGRATDLQAEISSQSSTQNALSLLGLLSIARAIVDSELTDIRIRCGNDTAITWFGNRSIGKTKTDGHDPETLKRLENHLLWLNEVSGSDDYTFLFTRKDPVSGSRPSVTIGRGNRIVLQASC